MPTLKETESAIPVNHVGGGSVQGMGASTDLAQEPGVKPRKKKLRILFPLQKRGEPTNAR